MPRLMVLMLAVLSSGCAMLQPASPVPPPAPPQPEFVVPPGTEFVSAMFGYSQAVRVGPWVTTSAIPGFDVRKRAFPEDFAEQARAAFELLRAVLESAGARMEDVTELETWQLDMEQFNATLDARNAAFGSHRPTWVPVGVNALLLPTMQIQVRARAYAPLPEGESSANNAAAAVISPAKAKAAAEPQAEAQSGDETPRSRPPFMNRPGY